MAAVIAARMVARLAGPLPVRCSGVTLNWRAPTGACSPRRWAPGSFPLP
ncbi:MAG TPA: hypothetical protein VGU21_11205 [Streptosporangiaceae bacterium]|nr:hypothetical protein [Streptosporangiaceae bacterium]